MDSNIRKDLPRSQGGNDLSTSIGPSQFCKYICGGMRCFREWCRRGFNARKTIHCFFQSSIAGKELIALYIWKRDASLGVGYSKVAALSPWSNFCSENQSPKPKISMGVANHNICTAKSAIQVNGVWFPCGIQERNKESSGKCTL